MLKYADPHNYREVTLSVIMIIPWICWKHSVLLCFKPITKGHIFYHLTWNNFESFNFKQGIFFNMTVLVLTIHISHIKYYKEGCHAFQRKIAFVPAKFLGWPYLKYFNHKWWYFAQWFQIRVVMGKKCVLIAF